MPENLTDGYIYVDYSHMENAADDMIQQTKAIATTIEHLNAELNELRKTWAGDDAATYNQKQDAWNAAVKQMEQLLNSNAALLTDVSGNYRYSENALSQMWSEVKIGR